MGFSLFSAQTMTLSVPKVWRRIDVTKRRYITITEPRWKIQKGEQKLMSSGEKYEERRGEDLKETVPSWS